MEHVWNNSKGELEIKIQARLCREIQDLREVLVRVDRDDTQSLDDITEHTKRISDCLQTISDNKLDIQNFSEPNKTPIHELLSAGPLIRTEIPIDTLTKLISIGFDVNEYHVNCGSCLEIAVKKSTLQCNKVTG